MVKVMIMCTSSYKNSVIFGRFISKSKKLFSIVLTEKCLKGYAYIKSYHVVFEYTHTSENKKVVILNGNSFFPVFWQILNGY